MLLAIAMYNALVLRGRCLIYSHLFHSIQASQNLHKKQQIHFTLFNVQRKSFEYEVRTLYLQKAQQSTS